jgi:hypothetical protein
MEGQNLIALGSNIIIQGTYTIMFGSTPSSMKCIKDSMLVSSPIVADTCHIMVPLYYVQPHLFGSKPIMMGSNDIVAV